MGRFRRFSDQEARNLLDEYERVDAAGRKEMAARLNVGLPTLTVYISKWRKKRKEGPVAQVGDVENDSFPF